MTNPAWKKAERRLASLFGTKRRPLSGGNQGGGRDDSLHHSLFLECKWSSSSSLWTLYDKTRKMARREGRVPVLGHALKGRPGILLSVLSTDLDVLLQEYAAAQGLALLPKEEVDRLQAIESSYFQSSPEDDIPF